MSNGWQFKDFRVLWHSLLGADLNSHCHDLACSTWQGNLPNLMPSCICSLPCCWLLQLPDTYMANCLPLCCLQLNSLTELTLEHWMSCIQLIHRYSWNTIVVSGFECRWFKELQVLDWNDILLQTKALWWMDYVTLVLLISFSEVHSNELYRSIIVPYVFRWNWTLKKKHKDFTSC